MSFENGHNDSLIRMSELIKMVSMSKSQIWLMIRKGQFPKPYKPSERVSVWLLSEVSDWMRSLSKE